MLTPEGILRLMFLHLLKHSLFLITPVFMRGSIWRQTRGCIFISLLYSALKWPPSAFLSCWAVHTPTFYRHTHTHIHTSQTLHACMHANSRDSHQRICITLRRLLPFILLAPGLRVQAHTQMHRLWWIAVCQPFIPVANQLDFAELSIW